MAECLLHGLSIVALWGQCVQRDDNASSSAPRVPDRSTINRFESPRFVSEQIEEIEMRALFLAKVIAVFGAVMVCGHGASASVADDIRTIKALDTEYQAAVQKNDAAAMGRLLADDFVLVEGSGGIFSKGDLLKEARSGRIVYERQDDSEQSVHVWGDTAVITAKLRGKGTENGKPFEWTLWFSDTYVRTATGWRYVFGQASLPLPKAP